MCMGVCKRERFKWAFKWEKIMLEATNGDRKSNRMIE
jgi:hypothetical protein